MISLIVEASSRSTEKPCMTDCASFSTGRRFSGLMFWTKLLPNYTFLRYCAAVSSSPSMPVSAVLNFSP